METVLNILALVVTAGIAAALARQGVFAAAKALVALLVAGALGFGLYAPAAGLLTDGHTKDVWYFAADGLMLFAITAVAFFVLRMVAARYLRNEPDLPRAVSLPWGAVLGALTGYFVVGISLVVAQMLPTAPETFGYAPFEYDGATNSVRPGDSTWLGWDRATLGLYDLALSGALGADGQGFCGRYGDVYPPTDLAGERRRTEDGGDTVNVDDMLYAHWYRRWEYVKWKGHGAQGPVPTDEAVEAAKPGLLLTLESKRLGRFRVEIDRVRFTNRLADFPDERVGGRNRFATVEVNVRPVALPATLDTDRFRLVDLARKPRRFGPPLIHGQANRIDEETTPALPGKGGEKTWPEGQPGYGFPSGRARGHFLSKGLEVTFGATDEWIGLTLVYRLPKDLGKQDLRLMLEPHPAESPSGAEPDAAGADTSASDASDDS